MAIACEQCEKAGLDHYDVVNKCLESPAWAGYYLVGFDKLISPFHMAISSWLTNKINDGERRFIILTPRAHLKCVPDQKIRTPSGIKMVSDLKTGDHVYSCDTGDLKNKIGTVSGVQLNGIQRCVRVGLRSGREVILGDNHPVYSFDGWIDAGDLSIGTRIAVGRTFPEPTTNKLTPMECSFLGYMVGDGCLVSNGQTFSVSFTTTTLHDDFIDVVKSLGWKTKEYKRDKDYVTYGVSGDGKHTGGPRAFLRDQGLSRKNSHTKFVPNDVFGSSFDSRVAFIKSYFDCDGTVNVRSKQISASTVSEELSSDLMSLLLSIGVVSRRSLCFTKYNGENRRFFQVIVSGQSNIRRFAKAVRLTQPKQEKVDELVGSYKNDCEPGSLDTVPPGWQDDMPRGWTCSGNFRSGKAYSTTRNKIRKLSKLYPHLERLAYSDIFWDEVVSVESCGDKWTWDIEVDGYENFYINDVLTHNTSLFGISNMVHTLLKNPDERILYVMSARAIAQETLSVVQKTFMSDRMKHFFPARWLDPHHPDMVSTRDRMTLIRPQHWREASIKALGLDSTMTGGHFTYQIFDDLIDKTMKDSIVQQESAIDFFRDATNMFVDMENDIRLVIGTLWEGEFYDWLLYRSGLADHYEKLVIGCYVDHRYRDFLASIGKATTLGDGDPVWPDQFSKTTLDFVKLEEGPATFSRQFLNIPAEDDYQRFRKEDFREYKISNDYKYCVIGHDDEYSTKVPLSRLLKVMIIDPATGEHKKTDESAINVTGFDRATGKIFVLEDWASRVLPHALIDRIFELAAKWDVQYVCPEDISYQKTLKHFLLQEKAKRGGRFIVRPVKPEGGNRGGASKGTRIEGLEPFVRAGQVHVRKEHSKLVREALEVNIVRGKVQGKSPNRLDAFAYQTQFWKGAALPEEPEEDIQEWNPYRRGGKQARSYGLSCAT